MKYIILIAASLLLFGGVAQAQAVCPSGYTCTKIPVCPKGFVCRKIAATVSPMSQLDQQVTMQSLQDQQAVIFKQIAETAKNAPLMKVGDFWRDIWNQPVVASNYQAKMRIQDLQTQAFRIADQMNNLIKYGTTTVPQ